jgi:hypothetical protein
MCYGALLEDEVDRPLGRLVWGELPSALTVGGAALVAALAVLVWKGAQPALAAGSGAGAFVLGTALHQAIFVLGVGLLRWRARRTASGPA